MQISKINANTSFKGIWSYDYHDERFIGYTSEKSPIRSKVYYGKAIYHPFADETKEEIKEAMEKYPKNALFEYGCQRNRVTSDFKDCDEDFDDTWERQYLTLVNANTRGERLQMTSEEYEKNNMGNPNVKKHPFGFMRYSERYRSLGENGKDIQKYLSGMKVKDKDARTALDQCGVNYIA